MSFIGGPLDWLLKSLTRTNGKLAVELAIRYDGIINQILHRSKTAVKPDRIWLIMEDRVFTMSSADEFAPTLWGVLECEIQINNGVIDQSLQSKFYLRQYMEEMKEPDKGVALRVLAFQKEAAREGVTEETLRILDESYKVLHQTLIGRGVALSEQTGGVWSVQHLPSMKEYHEIFFPKPQMIEVFDN